MVGSCAEVVVGLMQLEGCAFEGYGFQGAGLALVLTQHVVIQWGEHEALLYQVLNNRCFSRVCLLMSRCPSRSFLELPGFPACCLLQD